MHKNSFSSQQTIKAIKYNQSILIIEIKNIFRNVIKQFQCFPLP